MHPTAICVIQRQICDSDFFNEGVKLLYSDENLCWTNGKNCVYVNKDYMKISIAANLICDSIGRLQVYIALDGLPWNPMYQCLLMLWAVQISLAMVLTRDMAISTMNSITIYTQTDIGPWYTQRLCLSNCQFLSLVGTVWYTERLFLENQRLGEWQTAYKVAGNSKLLLLFFKRRYCHCHMLVLESRPDTQKNF